jgi:hypothetical protein
MGSQSNLAWFIYPKPVGLLTWKKMALYASQLAIKLMAPFNHCPVAWKCWLTTTRSLCHGHHNSWDLRKWTWYFKPRPTLPAWVCPLRRSPFSCSDNFFGFRRTPPCFLRLFIACEILQKKSCPMKNTKSSSCLHNHSIVPVSGLPNFEWNDSSNGSRPW